MTIRYLAYPGLKLPEIAIVHERDDIETCKRKRVPYMIYRGDPLDLIKAILIPFILMECPTLKPWLREQGLLASCKKSKNIMVNVPPEPIAAETNGAGEHGVADIAKDTRLFKGAGGEANSIINLMDYIGDLDTKVCFEALQSLKLLPEFVGTIGERISRNFEGSIWTDGYNKKLGIPVGTYSSGEILNNLIILDISGSIPSGISSTMLFLIDTLRNQANADLIVTGGTSKFYPAGSEIPSPQELRKTIGLANESYDFDLIMRRHIIGKEWGNVIGFGDNDTPDLKREYKRLANHGTVVHQLYSFHTCSTSSDVGYVRWCDWLGCDPVVHRDKDWADILLSGKER